MTSEHASYLHGRSMKVCFRETSCPAAVKAAKAPVEPTICNGQNFLRLAGGRTLPTFDQVFPPTSVSPCYPMLQGLLDHQEAFLHIATVAPCIALPPADDASVLLWQMQHFRCFRPVGMQNWADLRRWLAFGRLPQHELSLITDTVRTNLPARHGKQRRAAFW